MMPISRTRRDPSVWQARSCCRRRAPWRAHVRGPFLPRCSFVRPAVRPRDPGYLPVVIMAACSSRGHRCLDLLPCRHLVTSSDLPSTPHRCEACPSYRCSPAVRCWTRCALTCSSPSGPATRSARRNALRRSARSRHARSGCRCAPRPGIHRRTSGLSSPPTATVRIRSDRATRARHPTHVRTGSARRAPISLSRCT